MIVKFGISAYAPFWLKKRKKVIAVLIGVGDIGAGLAAAPPIRQNL